MMSNKRRFSERRTSKLNCRIDNLINKCRFIQQESTKKKLIFQKPARSISSKKTKAYFSSSSHFIENYIHYKGKHEYDNGKLWGIIIKDNNPLERQATIRLTSENIKNEWAEVFKRNRRKFGSRNWGSSEYIETEPVPYRSHRPSKDFNYTLSYK